MAYPFGKPPEGLTDAQYISCYTVPGPKGSTLKISCDAYGNAHDAHDPKLWSTAADVMARPWRVGFVITRAARRVFLDLDKCWDQAAGCWKPIVAEIMAWFPDAYFELSNSGTGIHLIFTADMPDGHRCKNAALGLEVYSDRRFVLLTGTHARGRADVDYSHLMPAFLAKYGLEPEAFTEPREEGRSPLWNGPEDDEGLLALMLSQGHSGARSGLMGKATVAQIWAMDHAALAASWGTEGRSDGLPFDHSSVDMAMMSHLAYFTGNDEARMVRLFERWPGYREWKYRRARGYHMRRVLARAGNNPHVLGEHKMALVGTAAREPVGSVTEGEPLTLQGAVPGLFYAYLPNHTFYNRATHEFWPAASVDDLIPPIAVATKAGGVGDITVKATKWLARNHGVSQRTWFPGYPEIIEGVIRDGEIIISPGQRILNTYVPPSPPIGNAHDVEPFLAHVRRLYPVYWGMIIRWMAFVAQNPGVKINHALVLGGATRIGKDTILDPLEYTVGLWNAKHVKPETIITEKFNDYLQCRLLVIDEAKDTGGESKYQFYETMKTIIAAPPNSHRINPKGTPAYIIPNINNTVVTTNHKIGGMYIAPGDGRYLVMWSDAVRDRDGLNDEYFDRLYAWLYGGGRENVKAYLMAIDVSDFKPKGLPYKTEAYYEMIEGAQSAEHHDLADVVESMNGHPFTLEQLAMTARDKFNDKELSDWINSKANATKVTRSLNEIGAIKHPNPNEKRGRWKIGEKQLKMYICLPSNLPHSPT